jgi:SNF family Na+-dependent transporter
VDQVAGELLLAVGALMMSIFVGWVMKDPAAEMLRGAGPRFAGTVPTVVLLVKWLLPPVIAIVVWFQIVETWAVVLDFFGAG